MTNTVMLFSQDIPQWIFLSWRKPKVTVMSHTLGDKNVADNIMAAKNNDG